MTTYLIFSSVVVVLGLILMANVSSRPAPYQVGEQVEIIYDPNKPQKAHINRFLYRWFQVLMVFGFGVFLLLMGLLGLSLLS